MTGPRRIQRAILQHGLGIALGIAVATAVVVTLSLLVDLPGTVEFLIALAVSAPAQWRFSKWHDRQDAIEGAELEEQP